MATERQIEANRKNAMSSTGPTSVEGKERSRCNSTTHGMSGSGTVAAATRSEEFEARKKVWNAEIQPDSVEGMFALDRAVGAVLRVEACDRAYHAVVKEQSNRAKTAWADDRRAEARKLFATLHDNPALIIPDLESSRYGVELLLELWLRLTDIYYIQNDWSEYDRSLALDMIGIPLQGREGKTPVDPRAGVDVRQYRRDFVEAQIARLNRLKDKSLDDIDALERAQAESGMTAILSKPATLILRYEREAMRTFHRAIKEIRNPSAAGPVDATQTPPVNAARLAPEPEVVPENQVATKELPPVPQVANLPRPILRCGDRTETNPISTPPTAHEPRNRHERRALEAQNRHR